MFFSQTAAVGSVARFFVATLLCLMLLFNAHLAHAEGVSITFKGVGLMLFAMTLYEIGDRISPINEWTTEIRELATDEKIIERWLMVLTDADALKEFQKQLQDIRNVKREKTKRLTRFKTWFYPAVGVVTTGIILLYAWVNGGTS